MGDRHRRKPPQWARYQIATAIGAGVVGVALFVVQAVSEPFWSHRLDFGMLPWGLVSLAVYVLFGLHLGHLTGGSEGDEP